MADFLGMMKQAAQLQSKMQAMQDELGNVEVEGISGGGLVAVRMTAKMEVKGVRIDPSLMKPEEKEIAEDLIVAAHAEARRKAEVLLQEKMKNLTGGLPEALDLSTRMSRAWVHFVRHGDPGHTGLPAWPAVSGGRSRRWSSITDAG